MGGASSCLLGLRISPILLGHGIRVSPWVTGASSHAGAAQRRVNPDEARQRMAERDTRLAGDARAEAERFLGDPPRSRSALAQASQDPIPRRSATGWRVDLWRK